MIRRVVNEKRPVTAPRRYRNEHIQKGGRKAELRKRLA
jgi:hypothetical protein